MIAGIPLGIAVMALEIWFDYVSRLTRLSLMLLTCNMLIV
jgi:hypothetical protein